MHGQWNYNNNGAMNNQQLMKMQGKENKVIKPSPSLEEHRSEYLTLLMENIKGENYIDPSKAASLTALSNIFAAKSTTTTTSSNKEAWYQSNKPAIRAWSNYNPEILTMNGKLFEVICSSAHKNTKKEAVENNLFVALNQADRYFERGICNEELSDTIIDLKFKPDNLIAGKHNKGLGIAAVFEQGAETVQQLKQRSERLKSGNMTVVDDAYIDNMILTTGKRPNGENETAKAIDLDKKLVENVFGPWCLLSQWMDGVHDATVALATKTRDQPAKEWQNMFGDGILSGVHEGTVIFFSQKFTKEQVDSGMTIDMTFHTNFLNGLKAGQVVVAHLRPPLFKQTMYRQPHIDLTATPNTPQERGTKRTNSEGNTNKQNQRNKTNALRCTIEDDQKKLVEECYKVAKERNESFNIYQLMKCMGYTGKQTEFQKHLKLENA